MKEQDIPAVNRILKKAYDKQIAPIVDLVKAQTRNPFKILVATILSARTRDETTAGAVKRLFKRVESIDDLEEIPAQVLEKLIYPVGFYHTKTRHLKALPAALRENFGGKIPESIDDLCRLPGVGRKTANLVVAMAFEKPAICVDVHVHRITNRLGLIETATPYETEMTLREILPRRYWRTWNSYLVSFGQTVCLPRNPKCKDCPIRPYCDRVGV